MRAGAVAVVGLAVALTLIALCSSMQHVGFSAQRSSLASMETPVPPPVAQQPRDNRPQPQQPTLVVPQTPLPTPSRGLAAAG